MGDHAAILTSKVPVTDVHAPRFKEKIETEVIVPDPVAWKREVQKVGLREGFRYEKYRTSFRFGGAHLDLDETPVGVFLEIEGAPAAIDRIAGRPWFFVARLHSSHILGFICRLLPPRASKTYKYVVHCVNIS